MTVYLTKALKERYQHIHTLISGLLSASGMECKDLGGPNLWCRDFMPVKTNTHYTKFQYKTPGWDQWPSLKVLPEVWHPFASAESPLILDGGNVEQGEQVVLMSEVVLEHNLHIEYRKLVASLESTFHREIVFLPVEPGDTLGHVDGIARFIDAKTVMMNDYSKLYDIEYQGYMENVYQRLRLNGFEVTYIPNAYHRMPKITERQFRQKYPLADDFNPGYGYYLNWYKVGSLVFMPVFNIPEDNDVYKAVHGAFPKCEVVPVNCSELSMEGGLCNCVTWEWEVPCRA